MCNQLVVKLEVCSDHGLNADVSKPSARHCVAATGIDYRTTDVVQCHTIVIVQLSTCRGKGVLEIFFTELGNRE